MTAIAVIAAGQMTTLPMITIAEPDAQMAIGSQASL
jgi:hypothetical protein